MDNGAERRQAIDCGSLPIPRNGSHHGQVTVYPNTIKFACDYGFNLIGSSVRRCQSNGLWDGTTVQCIAVDCGPLSRPLNGSLHGSLTVFPNVIQFSCDKGFLLRGSSSRTCQANRTWSGTLTTCEAIDCGRLPVPMNGSIHGDKTVYPNIVRFSCNEGFDLIGSSVRACSSFGTWDGQPSSCRAVDCGALTEPKNGSFYGSLTVFPNSIKFTCNEGFVLKGSSTRECQANRQWSGAPAVCEAVDCGRVAVPLNGSKHGLLTVYPNTVRFSCQIGFLLRGAESITCEATAKWSDSVPRCEAIDCGSLPMPRNGSRDGPVTVYPNKIKFACDYGFNLIGSSVRRCQSNGLWDGTTVQCIAVECSPLYPPTHGSVKVTGITYTSKSYYSCNVGYTIQGIVVGTCQANRKWSGIPPTCSAVDCGDLPLVVNGNMSESATVFPNRITFICKDGFSLIGSKERQCQANGQWSGVQPFCRGMLCKSPIIPKNSYMTLQSNETYRHNDVVHFSCNPGFFMRRGEPSMICIHGKWSDPQFICAAPKCNPPLVPINAYITFPPGKRGPYLEDDQVHFSCIKGYTLSGYPSIKCKDGWTRIRFTCNPVKCGKLEAPSNGEVENTTGITFKKVYRFSCKKDQGFKIQGSVTRTCQANKIWSGVQPTCYLLSCPTPKVPRNGFKLNFNYTFNNIVRFGCNKGYSPRGFNAIQCQLNEKWTSKPLTCLECTNSLGMRNKQITNKMLSASSERDFYHVAKHGRLFDDRAWCSARSESQKYLEVNFDPSVKEITAFATQGHPTEYKWMTKYELQYALGARWFPYQINGKVKVFEGNSDHNSVKKHFLVPSIIAHRLRIYQHKDTQSFIGSSVCLRAEFYGCDFYTECLTKGTSLLALYKKTDSQKIGYIRGYVISMDDDEVTVVPHDRHKSLMHERLKLNYKEKTDEVFSDDIPQIHQVSIGQSILAFTYKDGQPIYKAGVVKNILGSRKPWYQVAFYDGSTTIWTRRNNLRLKNIPKHCGIARSYKMEIRRH